ncbi:MAG: Gfo/Idh/MocA family oxidoreductase [Aliidongia sp.]
MHILIVRLGTIGRHHLGLLQALDPAPQITVWRHRRSDEVLHGVATVYDLDSALAAKPDAAFLCGPASEHVEIARQLAEHGIHLFVEKPISDRLDGTAELIEFCARRDLVLAVGYCLRFHPAVEGLRDAVAAGAIGRVLHAQAEVGQSLPDWRASGGAPVAGAVVALGGGVLLELSHEIDILCWALGRPVAVSARLARLGAETVDTEDCADLLLDFPGGIRGTIHLDWLSRPMRRSCTIIGTEGTLRADLLTGSLDLYKTKTESWTILVAAAPDRIDATYRAEIDHFLHCVATGAEPLISGKAALDALAVASAARESDASGRRVVL